MLQGLLRLLDAQFRITIFQELDVSLKEKERLSSELLLKSDLEAVVHQLEQEKQRLNKKLQSLAVTGKMLFFLAGGLLCVC